MLSVGATGEAQAKKRVQPASDSENATGDSAAGVPAVAPRTSAEKQAAQYSREALGKDFKAGRFRLGEGKLREAIELCTTESCSPPFLARLHRDLGYLFVAGLESPNDAREEFGTALSMDPTVTLTGAMQTPEAERAFRDATTKGTPKGSRKRKSKAAAEPESDTEAEPDTSAEISPFTTEPPPVTEAPSESSYIPNWFTLSVQQDWVYHSKVADACGPNSPYRCYDSDKIARVLEPGQYGGNQISSGGALAGTLSILLGYDRVVHPHVSLGVRMGTVVSGKALRTSSDQPFMNFRGEARVALWLGRNVLSTAGIRPYFVLAGGIAEADGRIVVDFNVPGDPNTYKLDAWKRSGRAFVSPGFGVQAAFTKNTGPVAEVRYMQFISPNVPVIGLQFGYAVGF